MASIPGRVTMFGGTGFIGRHVVRRLLDAGAAVRVGARRPDPNLFTGRPIEVVAASILDPGAVRRAVEDADAVVNLVGVVSESSDQTFHAIHQVGARQVAAAAKAAGASRLVFVSALGVSAGSPSRADRSKAAGEEAVRAAFPEATIVRPGLVFGPDDHFFNGFAQMARRAPALPLIGGGRTRFQPAYVEDVASAFLGILADPETRGQTYEVGGTEVYTFRELIEILLRTIGLRRPLVPVPFALAYGLGLIGERLPSPPLTRDQVQLLKTDKITSGRHPTLETLGIRPVPLEDILPTYLGQHR